MVVIDSAGYGAMEIHKSVSVIVPPGVHAGLSPAVGIPLPGFPGQSTVVLIDIQPTDIVVLRGLNVNHQGAVTGGIDWLSANGGVVHIESVTVNGFPQEGLFMGAPGGKLHVKDSIFRNNRFGIYIRGQLDFNFMDADRIRIENSEWGLTNQGSVFATMRDSTIADNVIGINQDGNLHDVRLLMDRCSIVNNKTAFKLSTVDPLEANTITMGNSMIGDPIELSGPRTHLYSLRQQLHRRNVDIRFHLSAAIVFADS